MIGLADLRSVSLFDGLSDEQLTALAAAGEEVPIEPGVLLFKAGDPADAWWVLLEGAIDLLRLAGREEAVVRTMDLPGLWAGGFRAWDPTGVYLASGRGAAPGRVLKVQSTALRELISTWFPLGAHLIDGMYGTARTLEATARQRESLVALGTLAAGLAHEINNPAAAAIRAVETLGDATRYLLDSLNRLAGQDLTSQQYAALDALRRELRPDGAPKDALALADEEDAITRWLERHGIDEAWQLAPALVAGGADETWCERLDEALGTRSLRAGLSWVTSALSVQLFLAELRDSTQRISNLVAAVKSYSHMDRAERQEIEVSEGLDSSIAIMGHKLPDNIGVVREYASDLPTVDAYAGELNQVWTNLIDNAIDAMPDGGKIRISTHAEPGAVVVEVADDGVGMSSETMARAFESFFTTKEVGKGTGLGLDIARRIVEDRHGGAITIESSPAGTTIRVRLPLAPISH